MPMTSDGDILASHPLSARLLKEYLEIAERRDWARLQESIERHMGDTDTHPGLVILIACQVLVAVAKRLGKSPVRWAEQYAAFLDKQSDPAPDLWTPDKEGLN